MKTKSNYTSSISLLAFFAQLLLSTLSSNAAVIVTNSGGTTPFAVSNSDLLQTDLGAAPVVTGSFTDFGTAGESVLRDGSDGGTSIANFSTTALVTTGSSVTYALNIGLNPLGYTLTQINTFGAWDDGRDAQNINIFYSTITDPTNFISLATVGFDPPFPGTFSRVSVTPGVGDAFIATNVHSVRFSFPTQESGSGGYRELDVFGTAIPEPSAAFSIGVSVIAFAFTRRRFCKKQ